MAKRLSPCEPIKQIVELELIHYICRFVSTLRVTAYRVPHEICWPKEAFLITNNHNAPIVMLVAADKTSSARKEVCRPTRRPGNRVCQFSEYLP